ncbi:MAG: sulfite exporter TauE/SafE family protein [Melioribacteraceae bacterium]|nr:sulfite exporter TauE/SafE family protein [Melioribacteraceae bacterium]
MNDLLSSLLLFVIGAVAAVINVNAGGGSSLTLPALIFLGLDSATANGTNRIAILMQNLSSSYAFKKENYQQFNMSMKLSLITLPGAIAGALVAIKISDELFHTILGIIMIAITITMIFPSSRSKATDDNENKKITIPLFITFVAVGFYGGFIQIGIGFILMAILNKAMNFSLIYVNMHKVFIILILTIPALLIFIISGNVNWYWGVSLGLGNALGGWWGTKHSIKKGDKFIKGVLSIAILIMALKLMKILP